MKDNSNIPLRNWIENFDNGVYASPDTDTQCSEVGTAAVRSISEPTKDLSVSASSIFSSIRGADG